MTEPTPKATLQALLAREAPVGVILRRGPHQWVQLILWHTDTDSFEFGQWFRGVIDAYDLSPDGKKFIYQAIKYQWEDHREPDKLHRWTAISRPPYLTALVLWQNWPYGWVGGFFETNHTLFVASADKPLKGSLPKSLVVKSAAGRDDAIYERKRQRDGWEWVQHRKWDVETQRESHPEVQRKLNKSGTHYIRLQIAHPGKSTYSVRAVSGESRLELRNATWADWDHRGRLVYAVGGQLFASEASNLESEPLLLADFTNRHFEEIVAPEWAQRW